MKWLLHKIEDALIGLQAQRDVELFYLTNPEARKRAAAYEDFKKHGGDPAEIERIEKAYGVTHS